MVSHPVGKHTHLVPVATTWYIIQDFGEFQKEGCNRELGREAKSTVYIS